MSRTDNADWGRSNVEFIEAAYPPVTPVPDSEAEHMDARLARPATVRVVGHVTETRTLPAGTPLEAKAARYRVNAIESPRRGRIKIRRDNHVELRELDGVYAIGVYQTGRSPDPSAFLDLVFVTPEFVEDVIGGSWAECRREGRAAATVPWSAFVEPSGVVVL